MWRSVAVLLICSLAAAAEMPRVAAINFYGLRQVTAATILTAVGLKPGDPLPPSKGELEDTIAKVPGVVQARVEAVCCEGPNTVLFIGVEEKGAARLAVRPAPAGEAVLPQALVDSYHDYLAAVERAAARGNAAEDLTAGHALMADSGARGFQQKFAAFAAGHLALLSDVLKNGAEPEQRAIAAAVIGYAADKRAIVDDLQYAIGDPDDSVRANAMRSLAAVAVLGARQPNLGIRVSPGRLVEALHSVVLSDRTEAVHALTILTDRPNPGAVSLLRSGALPQLIEMARWNTLSYALPPFLLLGRIAGLTDQQTQRSWASGARETVIRRARGTVAAKR
jgi:hypothetical protein